MKERQQAFWGILLAAVTSTIILGGVLLSLAENRFNQQAAGTPTGLALEEDMPTLVFILPVIASQTAGTTLAVTSTPALLPSMTPMPGCPLPTGWTTIILPNDESSQAVALRYGITVEQLASGNCWDVPLNKLLAGTSIYVPAGEVIISPTAGAWCRPQGEQACVPVLAPSLSPSNTSTPACQKKTSWYAYTVRSGDTLYSLSRTLGVSISSLQQANCLGNSTAIRAGQTIYLPYPPPPPPPAPLPTWTPRPPVPIFRTPTPTRWYLPTITTPVQPPIVYPTLEQTPPFHFPSATPSDDQPPVSPAPIFPIPGSTLPALTPIFPPVPPPVPAALSPAFLGTNLLHYLPI